MSFEKLIEPLPVHPRSLTPSVQAARYFCLRASAASLARASRISGSEPFRLIARKRLYASIAPAFLSPSCARPRKGRRCPPRAGTQRGTSHRVQGGARRCAAARARGPERCGPPHAGVQARCQGRDVLRRTDEAVRQLSAGALASPAARVPASAAARGSC